MSMDRTLKTRGSLARARSVLTRAERIEKLVDEGKFDPEADSPFALPKVRVKQSRAGSKTKKAAATEEAAAEGAGEAGESEQKQAEQDKK